MPTFVVRRHIPAPPEVVFDWLADVHHYTAAPAVFTASWLRQGEDVAGGVGAVRELATAIGWFREKITAYERGRLLGYKVIASIPPVRHDYGAVTFDPAGEGTDVAWTATTSVRLPLAGPLIDRVALGRAVGLAFGDILRACERALRA